MIPYEAPFVATLLRRMPPDRLAAVEPTHFQTWPARVVIKAGVIRELISNERARRTRCNPIAA